MKQHVVKTFFIAGIIFAHSIMADQPCPCDTCPVPFCDSSTSSSCNEFPYIRVNLSLPTFCDDKAFFILGEAGPYNYRINGTYGFSFEENHFFKIGAEFLTQDFDYKFFSGRKDYWVNQAAAGFCYRYLVLCGFIVSIDFCFEYANSKFGIPTLFDSLCGDSAILERRVAGAQFYGGSIGFTSIPWRGGEFSLALTYDDITWLRKFEEDNEVEGWGVLAIWRQRLWRFTELYLRAEIRRVFEFYEAQLNWGVNSNWTWGLFANYTHGKNSLPNIVGFGIQFSADLYGNAWNCAKDCGCDNGYLALYSIRDIQVWASQPAVYIPEVLNITDQAFLITNSKE